MKTLLGVLLLALGLGVLPAFGGTPTLVQSTSGRAPSTLTLNNVAAGNLLVFTQIFYRTTSNGAAGLVPTDTNGTFLIASAGTPAVLGGTQDLGIAISYEANAASGTHTITNGTLGENDWEGSLAEYSFIVTSSALDQHTNSKTDSSTHLSQATGTTGTTTSGKELVVIGIALGASTGVTDVGWTDPVSGFTTVYKQSNDATHLGILQAYRVVSLTGTQAATFNWTDNESSNASAAAIATFIGISGGGGLPFVFP
jgi:hypothetical protein